MECPQCHSDNPSTAARCLKCDTPFAFDAMTMAATPSAISSGPTQGVPQGWSLPSHPATSESAISPGSVLGIRYEIVQLLGQGGMGAVYKAKDLELDRLVALKVIRPEMAANPEILRRFKQELILARQITHRNVIRIFDLGEADGIKFITMEYIEGQDLKSLVTQKGKLSFEETTGIIEQVCLALEAAHAEGVVHRDLKPQNIMIDKQGKAAVMDFGIARSVEAGGMTQTGMLVGTPDYMSPEQVMGEHVDARSDLFTLGVILYELLTGSGPYKAETTQAAMYKRLHEVPQPPAEVDPAVPQLLSAVAMKCLQIDPTLRYQSAREILQDLEAWRAGATRGLATSVVPRRGVVSAPLSVSDWFRDSRKWLVPALVVAIAAVAFVVIEKPGFRSTPKPDQPAIALAILPFRNASGDPSLDWLGSSLADMLSTDVGQSARLRTVSQDRLLQVFSDLRITPGASIDPATLRRLAQFSNADILVSGQYASFGGQIRIDATLQDLKQDRSVPIKIEAVDQKDIPGAVDRLATSVRNNLAIPQDVIKELKASSFQPSSSSAAALKDYNQGVQLLRGGKNLDAVTAFQSATKEDPNFALAYSRLADADSELGYGSDAEQASDRAVELSQTLPLAEKYWIEAGHARTVKDNKKAIEAYENLAKTSPDNADVGYALGSLYADNGDFDKAYAQFANILKADPNNIRALWRIGGVQCAQGNPQAALDPLNKGLSLAVQVDNAEQKALILQALGVAYREMNKPDDAIKSVQDSMEITRKLGMKRLLANSLSELAQNQITIGKPDAAMTSYNQALQILHDIGFKKEYGDILINRGVLYQTRGDYDKALQDYKDALQIERDADDVNYQALCLSNIGDIYFAKYDTDNALIYYQQSLELRQKLNQPVYLAETLSALGDVHTAMGDYDQGLANLMNALDISRKANDTQDTPGISQSIGQVLIFQGRLGAAVSAMQDAVNGFRSTNNKSYELADSLNSLADTLALAGRGDESGKPLQEANSLASELKNESIRAGLLNTQGDAAFYRGDYKAALGAYQQAALAAAKPKDREGILIAKMNLARVAVADGRSQSAVSDLRAAIQQTDSLHLKYYWVRSSADLAQAMIATKDYAHARQELQDAQGSSEKLGLRLESARIHCLLGEALRLDGNTGEAGLQYQLARSAFEELKKDPGAEHVLDRSDLRTMYADAGRFAAAK
jgi:eukaryotic-like serine/threonine-protein kinase